VGKTPGEHLCFLTFSAEQLLSVQILWIMFWQEKLHQRNDFVKSVEK